MRNKDHFGNKIYILQFWLSTYVDRKPKKVLSLSYSQEGSGKVEILLQSYRRVHDIQSMSWWWDFLLFQWPPNLNPLWLLSWLNIEMSSSLWHIWLCLKKLRNFVALSKMVHIMASSCFRHIVFFVVLLNFIHNFTYFEELQMCWIFPKRLKCQAPVRRWKSPKVSNTLVATFNDIKSFAFAATNHNN